MSDEGSGSRIITSYWPDSDRWESDYKTREKGMKCMSCRADNMRKGKTTYFASFSKGYIIIENVSCLKCSQCGETFFKASVMEKIDNILRSTESLAEKVCILDYSLAA